jgi:hypothetical protein
MSTDWPLPIEHHRKWTDTRLEAGVGVVRPTSQRVPLALCGGLGTHRSAHRCAAFLAEGSQGEYCQ